MNKGLERTWTASLGRIRDRRRGRDPTPIYETLGWAVVLRLTGDLESRPIREICQLEQQGRKALKDESQSEAEAQRDEDHAYAIGLARAGVNALTSALSGTRASGFATALSGDDVSGDLLPPSPQRVERMLTGDLDGFAAASCALHLARRSGWRGVGSLGHSRGSPSFAGA